MVQPRETLARATGRHLRAAGFEPILAFDGDAAVQAGGRRSARGRRRRPDASRARRLVRRSPRSAPVRPDGRRLRTPGRRPPGRACSARALRVHDRGDVVRALRPAAAGTRTRLSVLTSWETSQRPGGADDPHPAKSSSRPPTPSGASGSHPSSSRSPARPAPSGRSPASTGTATRTAPTRASAAAPRCSRRRRSSSPAPAGRASGSPSTTHAIEEQSDRSYGMVRTEVRARTAAPTSGTSSPTAPARPGCATASTAPRSASRGRTTPRRRRHRRASSVE